MLIDDVETATAFREQSSAFSISHKLNLATLGLGGWLQQSLMRRGMVWRKGWRRKVRLEGNTGGLKFTLH